MKRPAHSVITAGLALGVALFTNACERLVGGRARVSECSGDDGCPPSERCDVERARCLPRLVADATTAPAADADARDAGPTEAGPADAQPADAQPADAQRSTEPSCFSEDAGAVAAATSGERPTVGGCTPRGWVFIRPGQDGQTEVEAGGGRAALVLPAQATVQLTTTDLLVTTPNPERDATPNVGRVDLTTNGPLALDFLEPRALPQGQPARASGVTAFVETTPREGGLETSEVVLHFDDGRRAACGRPGLRQWGVGVQDDGTVAFFEQARGSARQDVVVLSALDCRRRLALEVEGVIERDARIVADGRRLLWLRTTVGGRREVVYVPLDALVQGPRPLSVQGVTSLNPLELAAAGDWLLLTSYERGRRALRLFDLARGAERPIGGTGQSHAPSLIQDFAVWSSRTGTEAWEVRYERLPAR